MFETIMGWIGNFANIAGAIGAIAAAIGVLRLLFEERKKNQKIEILFHLEGEDGLTAIFPFETRRGDVSRAELQGRLALALRDQSKRYNIKFMGTPAYMRVINEIVEGKTSTLVIPMSAEEFAQFNV